METNTVQMSSREVLNTPMGPSRPVTERFVCPPEIYTHTIQEADLSAFFHLHRHIVHPGNPHAARDQVFLGEGWYLWLSSSLMSGLAR